MTTTPSIDMTATGKNIDQLRREAGITVRELQKLFGFATPQAIYKWQRGMALPTVDNLVILASALHVKIDDLLVLDQRENILQDQYSPFDRP